MKTLLRPLLPLIVPSAATLTDCVGYPWFGAMSDERLEAKYEKMKAECYHRIEMEFFALRTLYPSGVIPAGALQNIHTATPDTLPLVPSQYDSRVKCDNDADYWLAASKENRARFSWSGQGQGWSPVGVIGQRTTTASSR